MAGKFGRPAKAIAEIEEEMPALLNSVFQAVGRSAGLGHAFAENGMIKDFLQRRVMRPVMELLRQGTAPEKLALSIAVGLVVGVFPGLGWTTIACTLIALWFRLNLPAMQLANYVVYPLQLILFLPFFRAGEFLFHSARLPFSLSQILAMIRSDMWHAVKVLWVANVHAMAVWVILAAPAMYLLYRILLPVLRRLAGIVGSVRATDATENMV